MSQFAVKTVVLRKGETDGSRTGTITQSGGLTVLVRWANSHDLEFTHNLITLDAWQAQQISVADYWSLSMNQQGRVRGLVKR